MNMCLVWQDGTGFIETQKYIIPFTEPTQLWGMFFNVITQQESNTLKTSFIQATHFQCCHNHLKSICF